MPLTTDAVLYGLNDAKLAAMTADASSAPTYATALDVPGASNLTLTPIFESKQLTGDGVIIASSGKIVGYDVEFTMAKLPLAMLAVLQGGTVTASGTTPNMKQTYSITGASTPPGYWKIEGALNPGEVDFADLHVIAYKVKITEAPTVTMNDAYGDYATVTVKGKAVVCNGTGKQLVDHVMNESAAAIS